MVIISGVPIFRIFTVASIIYPEPGALNNSPSTSFILYVLDDKAATSYANIYIWILPAVAQPPNI